MDSKQSIAQLVCQALASCYPNSEQLPDQNTVAEYLEVPPEKEMGDYAFPCFKLSKVLRMGPPQIALALAQAIDAPHLCQAKAMGGYLNFFFNRENFAQEILGSVLAAGEAYGSGPAARLRRAPAGVGGTARLLRPPQAARLHADAVLLLTWSRPRPPAATVHRPSPAGSAARDDRCRHRHRSSIRRRP